MGQLGIRAGRVKDAPASVVEIKTKSGIKEIRSEEQFKWMSENSSFLRWARRSCFGYTDSPKTYQSTDAKWILRAPLNNRHAFLQGIADGDGGVSKRGYYFSTKLSVAKRIIIEHGIDALVPVIDWMEDNQVEQVKSCLVHGDYHGLNILARSESDFVTIDWSNAHIGDFRSDIAFTTVGLNSMGTDLMEHLVLLYETISGVKVNDLEYFMVLSSFWNLLRIYSNLFDHSILGENDVTANLFKNEYRDYTLSVIKVTQDTTGVSLDEILDALE